MSVRYLVLGRTVQWSRQFIDAMGWDHGLVKIITDRHGLMGHSKAMLFKLNGWSDLRTEGSIREMLEEIEIFRDYPSHVVVDVEAEKIV